MCYSEKLIKEAGGYLIGTTWVVVGYKAMRVMGDTRIIREVKLHPRLRLSKDTGYKWIPVPEDELSRSVIEREVPTGHSHYVSLHDNTFKYKFGEVMTDKHGFHLAATEAGARKAGADMVNAFASSTWLAWTPSWNPKADPVIEEKWNVAICRVLARQSSITKSNHVHRLMLIEPGKGETMDQVYRVAGHYKKKGARPDQVLGDPAFMATV